MTIAVIGAGMAGLSAARLLSERRDVVLFDKSRGVGGRMSTRYAGDFEFDHGAQYFTVTDPEFQAVVEALSEDGEVAAWPGRGLYLKTGELSADTGRLRFVGAPRMNRVPKALAKGLSTQLGRRVSEIGGAPGRYSLTFEDGSRDGPFDQILCTAPAPQAAALLPKNADIQSTLSNVSMHACFALMIGTRQAFDPGWASLRVRDLPISWMAVNSDKPGRGDATTLVVHADPDWSDEHAEADRGWVMGVMLETASALTGLRLDQAEHIALHRWLYAYSDEGVGAPFLRDSTTGIWLAGDWCLGGRVEGAFVSGRVAAQDMLDVSLSE